MHRPLPRIKDCPNCKCTPTVRFRFFKGWRVECSCGVCGPYKNDDNFPHHEAMIGWSDVFGSPLMKRPPPPNKFGIHCVMDDGTCKARWKRKTRGEIVEKAIRCVQNELRSLAPELKRKSK